MAWDLEERIEDAFVAYLRQNIPGDVRAKAAWTPDPAEYPCVVVGAVSSSNMSEDAEFNGRRSVTVTAGLMVEAAEEKADGVIVASARSRNARVRDAVFSHLCVNNLATHLNAVGIPGVLFSLAHPTQMTREVDGENGRLFVTILTFEVIAQPSAI